MDDALQFVQQFLGATDAEGRDQHAAAIFQGALYGVLQNLYTLFAVLVQAVAVGAFYHQLIAAPGGLGGVEQWRVAGAHVSGEDNAAFVASAGLASRTAPRGIRAAVVLQFALHVGRAENMAGALQADAQGAALFRDDRLPAVVGQRPQLLLDVADEFPDQSLVSADTDFQRILQYQRQQFGGGLGTVDGAAKAGGDQVGNTAHVVYVHVSGHQRLHRADVELDRQAVVTAATGRGFRPLEEAAVDQYGVVCIHK